MLFHFADTEAGVDILLFLVIFVVTILKKEIVLRYLLLPLRVWIYIRYSGLCKDDGGLAS
jgi:hypothetical protein